MSSVLQVSTAPDFAGLGILIVEDEAAIRLLLEDVVLELECNVIASVGSVAEGLALANDPAVELALLDINLAGVPVYPVADRLRINNIPFIFMTGALTAEYEGEWVVLQKPFVSLELIAKMSECLVRHRLSLMQSSP